MTRIVNEMSVGRDEWSIFYDVFFWKESECNKSVEVGHKLNTEKYKVCNYLIIYFDSCNSNLQNINNISSKGSL